MEVLVNALQTSGRHLLQEEPKNNTFLIAIIVAASLVGALILGAIGVMVFFKCCRSSSAAVHPSPLEARDVEKGQLQQQQLRVVPALLPGTADAVPPWEQYGQKPPGALLAAVIPTDFQPFASNPRPPGAPPYERLLIISSRVQEPMKLVGAALPNVGAVVYDWKLFSLQELLLYIKKVLGPAGKVTSIAVIAPGNKPGCVSLLEGHTTNAEKLKDGGGELGQFWRVLAGCVAANGVADGRRVDLLGCRVGEEPQEGAALLKALWCLTGVPFTASEDAGNGYQLTTFLEEPASGALSIIASTIQGLDLYFNRQSLLGIQPTQGAPGQLAPLPGGVYAPPLPAGLPPPASLAPLGAVAAAGAAGGLAQVSAPKDIFSRFLEAVAVAGSTPSAVFTKYDKDGSGYLSPDEVLQLVLNNVPNSTALDSAHFASILDLDGNAQISLSEFLTTLEDNKKVAAAVRSGRDDTALMKTLHEYLSDNAAVIKTYFTEADVNKSGTLDHKEVLGLVASIPGLLKDEQRFIASYLYQLDTTGKGQITFDQLKEMVKAFGTPAAQAAVHTPLPIALVAQPAPAVALPSSLPAAPAAVSAALPAAYASAALPAAPAAYASAALPAAPAAYASAALPAAPVNPVAMQPAALPATAAGLSPPAAAGITPTQPSSAPTPYTVPVQPVLTQAAPLQPAVAQIAPAVTSIASRAAPAPVPSTTTAPLPVASSALPQLVSPTSSTPPTGVQQPAAATPALSSAAPLAPLAPVAPAPLASTAPAPPSSSLPPVAAAKPSGSSLPPL